MRVVLCRGDRELCQSGALSVDERILEVGDVMEGTQLGRIELKDKG